MPYDEPGARPRAPRAPRQADRYNPRARAYALRRLRQVANMGLDESTFGMEGAEPGLQLSSIARAGLQSSDPTLRWRQVSAALAQRGAPKLDRSAEDDARARMLALMEEAQNDPNAMIPDLAQKRAVQMAPLLAAVRQSTSPPGPGPLEALRGLAGRLKKRAPARRMARRGIGMAE